MSGFTDGTRYVDMWAFKSLHPSNIGLLQRLRSADDRQFGEHMDLCGSVLQRELDSRQWQKTYLVGIRSDVWSPDKEELQKSLAALQRTRREQLKDTIKNSGRLTDKQSEKLDAKVEDDEVMALGLDDVEKRRLVLKLFKATGERIRWVGTIEEITTREIHNSLGTGRTLLSLAVMLPGYDFLTMIQENHRTLRYPALFSFGFFDEKQQRMWYVNLKRKWISIGADYVIETQGKPVGLIDGKLIGFGYNAQITIGEPALADNVQFMDLISLFATSIGYHSAMRKSVRRRVYQAKQGHVAGHIIEDEEFWLLKNPRRRAA